MKERYRKIHEVGIKNFLSGNWSEEENIPENKIFVALCFWENFLSKVRENLKKSPLTMILAGEDYIFHSTLAAAFGELKVGTEDTIINSHLMQQLLSENIELNDVIIDGGKILLTASPIPESIILARGAVDQILRNTLSPSQEFNPYKGILHATAVRITKKAQFLDYLKHLEIIFRLGDEVRANPIRVKIKRIFVGNIKEFMSKKD